ncbi:MAG: bifunctional nuclease family protein [Cyanobacteria bacterium M_surface_10_m2_119]|nr:bifunctional nuclease family protein [Cyanobacteria bacterium M_surface_10_m2_119]
MVEMRVAGIALDAASRSPIVLLRDPSGRRQVPIWIDQAQAQNILAGLGDEPPPRPLSHDLMVALLDAGGLQLERVVIHTIEDSTFRAVLKLQRSDDAAATKSQGGGGGGALELDARPSDAIALAVRTGSPIWMLEEVVADASIPVDAEADAEDQDQFRRFLDSVSPAELVRHLSQAQPEPAEAGETPPTEEGDSQPENPSGDGG